MLEVTSREALAEISSTAFTLAFGRTRGCRSPLACWCSSLCGSLPSVAESTPMPSVMVAPHPAWGHGAELFAGFQIKQQHGPSLIRSSWPAFLGGLHFLAVDDVPLPLPMSSTSQLSPIANTARACGSMLD